MAQFGYTYRSISTYSTTREPAMKPFAPKSNGNNSSEGHVTRKTIVPINSSKQPYGGTATDDPASSVQKYPSPSRARGDDQKTSPVHSSPRKVDEFPNPRLSPTKVQNETNHPQRFSPVANSTGWRHSSQPAPNHDGAAQVRKPIGSSGTNINHNGYGDKEGRKPIGSTLRNDNHHDGYNNGGYGGGSKGGPKPIGSGAIMNDNHGNHNSYGGGSKKNDNYEYDSPNGYGPRGYGDHYGQKPMTTTGNYDGYGDDEHYNKREVHKPMTRIGNYDGNNKEQRRSPLGFGIGSTSQKDNYCDDNDSDDGNYYNKEGNNHKNRYSGATMGPKFNSDWTTAPRIGTRISEPTHDIEKALELLKREAGHSISNDYLENGTVRRTGSNQSPRFSSPINSYGSETIDRRRGGSPRTEEIRPPTRGLRVTIIDGRDHSDDDDIIDSWEAEKIFRGTRVW